MLEQRRKGINRYEIYAILKPTLKSHTPSPSTIYAITKRHGLNRLTKEIQTTKRRIIKTRAGELRHLDSHHLSREPGALHRVLRPGPGDEHLLNMFRPW